MKEKRFLLLYAGLALLALAFVLKYALHVTPFIFGITLGMAIALKVLFLLLTFKQKGFHMKLPIILILIGVAMIITAANCKGNVPMPLYHCLFFGAIGLKITGVLLLIFKK